MNGPDRGLHPRNEIFIRALHRLREAVFKEMNVLTPTELHAALAEILYRELSSAITKERREG